MLNSCLFAPSVSMVMVCFRSSVLVKKVHPLVEFRGDVLKHVPRLFGVAAHGLYRKRFFIKLLGDPW